MRGATSGPKNLDLWQGKFQSTLPMRGATRIAPPSHGTYFDFNPHSPCGERLGNCLTVSTSLLFQSTLPMRGATAGSSDSNVDNKISIHTPHAGSDSVDRYAGIPKEFQSTLPMRGATLRFSVPAFHQGLFQSTLPMRGATFHFLPNSLFLQFQSTLPMRGATWKDSISTARMSISIHTPHAGSDPTFIRWFLVFSLFQSTLPMRGATGWKTHARPLRSYFNPHSPCGERPAVHQCLQYQPAISIHTPHAGSDWKR